MNSMKYWNTKSYAWEGYFYGDEPYAETIIRNTVNPLGVSIFYVYRDSLDHKYYLDEMDHTYYLDTRIALPVASLYDATVFADSILRARDISPNVIGG